MRNAFLQALMECAAADARICLVVGDLGYSVVEPFRDRFGARFLNAGIAEQNMTGVAAGMAMAGHKAFTYSIANFPTLRCFEQIRNDVCHHGADVTVVAVGGGLGYGTLGYSHHAVQDVAVMRSLPGMLMATPGDPQETTAVTRFLCERYRGPAYLRLGKGGEPSMGAAPGQIEPGIRIVAARSDIAVLCCGAVLGWAAPVAESHGATLASCPLWWPDVRSGSVLRDLIARHRRTIVVEEHLIAGGFGSFVREQLEPSPELQARVRCLALDARACETVGSAAYLRSIGGCDAVRLAQILQS